MIRCERSSLKSGSRLQLVRSMKEEKRERLVFHRELISALRVLNTTTHIDMLNHEVSPNYESPVPGFRPSMLEERQAATGLCPLNG